MPPGRRPGHDYGGHEINACTKRPYQDMLQACKIEDKQW